MPCLVPPFFMRLFFVEAFPVFFPGNRKKIIHTAKRRKPHNLLDGMEDLVILPQKLKTRRWINRLEKHTNASRSQDKDPPGCTCCQ